MRIKTRDAFLFLCASAFSVTCLSGEAGARDASPRAKATAHVAQAAPAPKPVRKAFAAEPRRQSGPILQCVTFARDLSGIHLSGNAHTWWYNAQGRFARGQLPERGAVLNFRASGGMRLGHVSVVSRVVSAREILVDDANWAGPGQRKGAVRRGASVIDVSPNNDWTLVRVANGIGSWGREYPTYGFIYPRVDHTAPMERIEIAAAAPLAPAPGRGATGGGGARPSPSGGWTWQGTVAVAMTEQPAPRQGLGLPPAETQRRPAAPARWTWVNGQAVAVD